MATMTHKHPRPWYPRGTAPRDYADAILRCNGDRKKIESIWARVPEDYKDWVQHYVKDWAQRQKAQKSLGR
jgi:hypothetical protein